MKHLGYFFAIIVLLAINLGLFPTFSFRGVAPNLLFLLVVLSALDKESYDFYFVAFICGLFLDFFSGVIPGTFVFGFLILAALLNSAMQNFISVDLNWKHWGLIFFFSLLFLNLFIWFYDATLVKSGLFSGRRVDGAKMLWQFPLSLLYNLILAVPIYKFLEKLKVFLLKFTRRS